MSQEVIVQMDDENRIVISPKSVCEELGLLVLDPAKPDEAKTKFRETFEDLRVIHSGDFDDALEQIQDLGWSLFKGMDEAHAAVREDRPGVIELDLSQDPDPFGNHGISILDRLAAMGWPADRVMIQDRREQVRPEDLL